MSKRMWTEFCTHSVDHVHVSVTVAPKYFGECRIKKSTLSHLSVFGKAGRDDRKMGPSRRVEGEDDVERETRDELLPFLGSKPARTFARILRQPLGTGDARFASLAVLSTLLCRQSFLRCAFLLLRRNSLVHQRLRRLIHLNYHKIYFRNFRFRNQLW